MARTQRRSVEDFEAVLRAISKQGADQVILVGGHAVNVWALAYRDRIGDRLKDHLPLTSADMDVYGTRNALLALHDELGGALRLSGPREVTDGTLILGVEPDTRELDVLRSVNGVPRIEAQDSLPLEVCGYEVPVLFPHLLLQGKLENALHLDQSERQDVKHVKMLVLVLREFIAEVVETATAENERPALALLQKTLAVITSDSARQFERLHGVDFREAMPAGLVASSPLKRLARFGQEQLTHALGLGAGKDPARPESAALPKPAKSRKAAQMR